MSYEEEFKKLEEETKKEKQRLRNLDINQLMREIVDFIKNVKDIHKIVYRLAFIYSSNDISSLQALQYLHELVDRGLISEEFKNKAIEDVKRWRKMVLDKEYISEKIEERLRKFKEEMENVTH